MTDTTAGIVAELAGTIGEALAAVGDRRTRCLGFLVTPAQVVARMVSAQTGDAGRAAVRAEVARLGGLPALVKASLEIEEWMEASLGATEIGRMPARSSYDYSGHPLFDRFSLDGGRLSVDRLPMRKDVAHLSAEIEGLHDTAPEPTGKWRGRLATELAPLIDGLPGIGESDLSLAGSGYHEGTMVRSTHPLLAEPWGIYGMRSLEHLPDVLIAASARRIALTLRAVHEDRDRLSQVVAAGQRGLQARLAAELGEVAGAGIFVSDTRIHMAHVMFKQGVMAVSHYNSSTAITLPGHTLKPETVRTNANISHKLDFNDVRRYELNLRERGEAMRSTGITVSPLLERLMRRDGVDRDEMLSSLEGEDAVVATGRMREMGFGRDVSKVEARNGHVDCHLKLGKGVTYRRGRIHATRTDLPDTVKDLLRGGPLSKLVEHPMLTGATVAKVTSARTGSLIVGVRLD
jgi:hypothetical protein